MKLKELFSKAASFLHKVINWFFSFAKDTWRILKREVSKKREDIQGLTKEKLIQRAKEEGKFLFLGGLARLSKPWQPSFLRNHVSVAYEDCFDDCSKGLHPLKALTEALKFICLDNKSRWSLKFDTLKW